MIAVDNEINITINPAFQKAFEDENPYACIYGGSGGGKSWFAAQKCLIRSLNEDDNRTLVVMKVGSKLRTYAFQTFVDVLNYYNLNDLFSYTVSPLQIKCNENGNLIFFIGLDDPESIKSIPGIKNIWVEEATALLRRDFQQLNLRIRGESIYYKQCLLTFNPISKNNWIYEDFFQARKYSPCGFYHSTFTDNPYAGSDYEKRIKDSYEGNENQFKVYYSGEWGEQSNSLIYTNWYTDDTISKKFNDYEYSYSGVDFGWNNPSVAIGIGNKENKIYIFKEIYVTQKTDVEFANILKDAIPYHTLIVADSSNPSGIKEIRNQGLRCRGADKSPGSVISGINWLKGREIIIHPDCEYTIKEIKNYSYIYNNSEEKFLDEPQPYDNHCMDALRYGTEPLRYRKFITAGLKIF